MDWFEKITGFPEQGYGDVRARLEVDGALLRSKATGKAFRIGELRTPSLAELRRLAAAAKAPKGRPRVSLVSGDVRAMHADRDNAGALFQVASQFNLLEMIGPGVTPEMGVARYAHDRTQGPACAMAAGAATIYRNYFAPVGGKTGEEESGQTADRQIDCLAPLGDRLADAMLTEVPELWEMKNGYALCTASGLRTIARHLRSLDETALDELRGCLRIGLHEDVEITDLAGKKPQIVSQAFCSALPVAYGSHPKPLWEPFARLVLEAAYEATLLCGALNAARGASDRVLLTALGGGAFGNGSDWIHGAIVRAMDSVKDFDLDVRLVSYGPAPGMFEDIASRYDRNGQETRA